MHTGEEHRHCLFSSLYVATRLVLAHRTKWWQPLLLSMEEMLKCQAACVVIFWIWDKKDGFTGWKYSSQNAQEADSKSQISQFFLLKQVRISEESHRALDCTSLTPCYMYNDNEKSWGKNNSCLQIRQLQSSRKENHLPKSAKWNSLHSYSNSRISVGPNFYFTSLNYPEASKTHFP